MGGAPTAAGRPDAVYSRCGTGVQGRQCRPREHVPVARTVSLCEDLSVIGLAFSVVSHVDGVVLRTVADLESVHQADLDDCADALMATLARRCTRCRTLRWGSPHSGSPIGYLGRQVR